MKKLIFFSFLLSLSFGASAQYLRIAEPGRVWYSFTWALGLGNYTKEFKIEGDTLMNGETYHKLIRKDTVHNIPGIVAFLKEDTVSGILNIFNTSRAGQIYDTLQYNFSLTQGDTVRVKEKQFTAEFRADSVFFFTDFKGIIRKAIWLTGITPNAQCNRKFQEKWIEGIGSTRLLVDPYPLCFSALDISHSLVCIFDNTTQIYGDTINPCYVLGQGETRLSKFMIYPNPIKRQLFIKSELPLQQARIYSLSGTLLLQKEKFENFIDVSSLKPGVFILEVTDQDGNVGRYKVAKE